MIRKMSLAVVLLFAVAMVSGCANIEDDSDRTRAEGAAVGATGGAVIGALIGQAIGGDTGSTLAGAAIGAAIGGAGGYAYGDHVAGQKEKYASNEDWLDACIADAKKTNREITAYNQNLAAEVGILRQETDVLKQQYANAADRQTKLQGKKKEVDALLEEANKQLADAKAELEALNSVVADANQSGQGDYAQTLDNEIEDLKASIQELEKRTEELASMSASMAV